MNCNQMHSVPFILHVIISHDSGANQALILFLWRNIFFHVDFFFSSPSGLNFKTSSTVDQATN